MKIEITLRGLPKGPNDRMHWAKKAKEAKQWRMRTAWECRTHPYFPLMPLQFVELMLVRGSSRACDIDNAIASFKPIIDGLKDGGIIQDDNPNVIKTIHYRHEQTPRNATYVKVIIEEVDR